MKKVDIFKENQDWYQPWHQIIVKKSQNMNCKIMGEFTRLEKDLVSWKKCIRSHIKRYTTIIYTFLILWSLIFNPCDQMFPYECIMFSRSKILKIWKEFKFLSVVSEYWIWQSNTKIPFSSLICIFQSIIEYQFLVFENHSRKCSIFFCLSGIQIPYMVFNYQYVEKLFKYFFSLFYSLLFISSPF